MAGSDYDNSDQRIGDDQTPIGWAAACNIDKADWDKADDFVYAFIITSAAHTPVLENFSVQWRKVGDAIWSALQAGAGALRQGTSAELNNGDPVGDSCGCQAGVDIEDSEELEGDDTTGNLQCTKNKFIEVQVAIDPANAEDGAKYEFQLYSNTATAGLGACGVTLTIEGGYAGPPNVPGWDQLEYSVEPPGGAAWNQILYVDEPSVGASWNRLRYMQP